MNNYGFQLLEFCKSQNIFIVNGRACADLNIGETTCCNVSVVHYFICSCNIFEFISDFHVNEFDALFSDVHNPICLSLKIKSKLVSNSNISEKVVEKDILWNTVNRDKYLDNFDWNLHASIEAKLSNVVDENITQDIIDDIVEDCNSLFVTAAKNAFGTKLYNDNKFNADSQWFGPDCKKVRKRFHVAKSNYRHRNSDTNKQSQSRKVRNIKRH